MAEETATGHLSSFKEETVIDLRLVSESKVSIGRQVEVMVRCQEDKLNFTLLKSHIKDGLLDTRGVNAIPGKDWGRRQEFEESCLMVNRVILYV